MPEMDLSDVVREGSLDAIRSLLDAGADVRYVRPHGYTAMIDAMYSRSAATEEQLLPVVRLLIARGADLDAESDYGESALRVASRTGCFEVVRVLLDAGADPSPLGWNPLMTAVALGSVEDVRARVESGDDLTCRDCWDRTPWLLSLHTGEVAKAALLLAAGASTTDRGRCGKTPLMYPIESGRVPMLEWLLAQGLDPNATDDYGDTALIEAAGHGATECVRLLLDAGAAVHGGTSSSAVETTSNLAVVRLLVQAGADINDINGAVRAALTRLPRDGIIDCTPAEYRATKHRVFGTANPQPMNFPFWKAMVTGGATAYQAREHFEHGETRINDGAVWCFVRFGMSITELPDGRIIEIAGEHEDYYDPDFCIYNDVVVHHGDGTFDIYGYPASVFPPTDFHTATLVGEFIYIIGSLGYQGSRRFGTTPVYRLDVNTLAIEAVETTGAMPGWISRHKARLTGSGIEVTGGKVCVHAGGGEQYEDNSQPWVLNVGTGFWSNVRRRDQ